MEMNAHMLPCLVSPLLDNLGNGTSHNELDLPLSLKTVFADMQSGQPNVDNPSLSSRLHQTDN